MLKIRTDGSIRVTRGDTADIEVHAYGQDGAEFDLTGWAVTMTVRTPDANGDVLFAASGTSGAHPSVHITADDTAKACRGVYDIQATKGATVCTLVDATPFEIIEDVTR